MSITSKYVKILILNYSDGNIGSIKNACKLFTSKIKFSNKIKDLDWADKIILPGQGKYDTIMKNLDKKDNLKKKLVEVVLKKKKPILGICAGMQIFSKIGFEDNKTNGLNFFNGEVVKINEKEKKNNPIKIPHIGWTTVKIEKKNKLFTNINGDFDAYFLHGYYFKSIQNKFVLAKSKYEISFPTVINYKNIYGTQFHPEKSLKNGLTLLKNFIELC
jgi:imidazole glycerol-phosphate synthase subunit HisH